VARLFVNLFELTEQEKKERWLKMEVTLEPKEFDCLDCGVHVYSWADDEAECCLVCTWIRSIPDITPDQEAEIRLMTATPKMEKKCD
jgi:hypothetical protein